MLPAYIAQTSMPEPPTPTSIIDNTPPPVYPDPMEYFEHFIADALSRQNGQSSPASSMLTPGPSSVASTPTISRIMAQTVIDDESPDPLGSMYEPSPTKKHKSAHQRLESPTRRVSQSKPKIKSKHSGKSKREAIIEIPSAKKPGASRFPTPDVESEEDELDWGDDQHDVDGDWVMKGEQHETSPGPWASTSHQPGQIRTGERDTTSKLLSAPYPRHPLTGAGSLKKLTKCLEDIFEEHDSFSAEPSAEDLVSSKWFHRLSKSGNQPLLSASSIERLTRYISRVQAGRNLYSMASAPVEPSEWDSESISRILKLLDRSIQEADQMEVFPDDRNPVKTIERPVKGGRTKKKTSPPTENKTATNQDDDDAQVKLDPTILADLQDRLVIMRHAALAVQCCLTIFDSNRLEKEVRQGLSKSRSSLSCTQRISSLDV